ncbi:protein MALE DISCOVERER 2-like [Neltuma alba]|uniref:protein MALE DISCOVERER 2-like n=1 Tax=Neltuma alba TaxID=207710 RepID=UPI0010A4C40A|nr:protein MALE DISCOVERER 2-like [Prosopis alba]
MGVGWNQFGLWFKIYIALISLWEIRVCWSLNSEGLALLDFRDRITCDPYGALVNWNPNDGDPCKWLGVHCIDSKVQILDLNSLSLEGTLAPELGKLSHLKSLVLCKNNFSGTVPKGLGALAKLELLDLRSNNFTGTIPVEVSSLSELKHLLLCGNKIEVNVCQDVEKSNLPSKWLFVDKCGLHRKFGNGVWQRNFILLNKAVSRVIQIKGELVKYFNALVLPLLKLDKALDLCQVNFYHNQHDFHEPVVAQTITTLINSVRRRLLDQSSNLAAAAAPVSVGPTKPIVSLPATLSSGAFPAVPHAKQQNLSPAPPPTANSPPNTPNQDQTSTWKQEHSTKGTSGNLWLYIIIIISFVVVLVIIAVTIFCLWRARAAKTISPWKTGISGQLQKAFVTGVPKLNRPELETACEDFSNIIDNFDYYAIYKGTLSSGVEIAVVSTNVTSSKEWSKNAEMFYRKTISTLSRVNHKNFINLIGFCEEEEPFTRMMIFEYAPNGSLFEHLHVKEDEYLDWSARTRIVMGIAYCLQYMHHDLNPPVSHSDLSSSSIYLTDDFAAKIAYMSFDNPSILEEKGSSHSQLPPKANPETNVYNFGMVLLEIISGKLPYSEEHGHLTELAADHIKNNRSINYMIDPILQSYEKDQLDVICEVIQDCIQTDARFRPPMKDVVSKLRAVINISPEQAVPRLSPLWWAELEILSLEAN